MKNSAQKIRTSHVGRLPVPRASRRWPSASRAVRPAATRWRRRSCRSSPMWSSARSRSGIDCIGDGEYWSALRIKWYDQQMTGLGTRPLKPGEVAAMRESTRERDVFRTLYADMDRVGTIACIPGERPIPPTRERVIVSGPVKTKRHRRDATPARLLQGGDRALRRRPGRGLRPRARAGMARSFHL